MNVRLKSEEIISILDTLKAFSENASTHVFLYGSRAKLSSKGGDIDLAWIVPENIVNSLNKNKYKIIVKLEEKLGEQKIDLSIITEKESQNDPFYIIALENAVELNHFTKK